MFKSPVFKFFDFLLGIPLIHDVLFGVYRMQIVEKSEKMVRSGPVLFFPPSRYTLFCTLQKLLYYTEPITTLADSILPSSHYLFLYKKGLPWKAFMEEQWDQINELKERAADMENPDVTIPDYYYAPIHAYKDGNLCWDSAMEEDLWSKLMIAPLYNNALDGDVQMRQEWLSITEKAIKPNPKMATDLGCGTGLSMYMLDSKFPSMEHIQGVDLSTFKLAVCEDKKTMMPPTKGSKYSIRQEAAEATTIASESQDLASLCLVAHESPRAVSKAIFDEAYRILKPGGSFTMLDLDKENLEILLENPFVAAIYKRTEPYMPEFLTLDPMSDLAEAGFTVTSVGQASKSHRVYVAQKPERSAVEAKLAEQGLL